MSWEPTLTKNCAKLGFLHSFCFWYKENTFDFLFYYNLNNCGSTKIRFSPVISGKLTVFTQGRPFNI